MGESIWMDDLQAHHFDTIIIGAGHNGLVCAGYLAKGGQRVLVLEAAETIGGLAATREFHPGFKISVAHTLSQFPAKIVRDLDLGAHGFKPGKPLATVGLNEAGEHVVIKREEISGVSAEDAGAYADYRRMMLRFAGFMKPVWLTTMPRIGNNSLSEILTFARMGLKLRLLGKDDMREFLRVATLPARDLMDENFENELLKAVLAWDGLIGSKMAPRSPNHTVLAMLYRMCGEAGGDHAIPAGGIAGLIGALATSAEAAGAETRVGARVARIMIRRDGDGLAATGVALAGGEQITADRVVSAADPKRTFLELVGVGNLEIEFTNRIRRLRCDGYVAKLHLALDGLPVFRGLQRPEGRMIIAPDMDAIEFAFDDAKYGKSSEQPVIEMLIPSLQEASLAPAGQHVLSAHVMYVPYELKGGWTEEAREALSERVISTIERYAPGIRNQILHRELLTPLDLERTFNVSGGHWHHTEFALDQMLMMRPTYEAAQYSTPIPGLYLCGAGCHPGGGLMGGPGHNAAREILK
ncbi:MAG: NAD(P)/FAD-dependent oxidoreductase [Sphingomonadales bacterium]